MKVVCAHCKTEFEKSTGHVNRAIKMGCNIYCNRECAGFGRRANRTEDENKKIKSDYDKEYRRKNLDKRRDQAHEYFKKDYAANPEKYRLERQRRMKSHVEYCRQPEYRKYKQEYDQTYRAKKNYGELWESFLILSDIEKIIDNREVKQINNLITKSTKRKRSWLQLRKVNYLRTT